MQFHKENLNILGDIPVIEEHVLVLRHIYDNGTWSSSNLDL